MLVPAIVILPESHRKYQVLCGFQKSKVEVYCGEVNIISVTWDKLNNKVVTGLTSSFSKFRPTSKKGLVVTPVGMLLFASGWCKRLGLKQAMKLLYSPPWNKSLWSTYNKFRLWNSSLSILSFIFFSLFFVCLFVCPVCSNKSWNCHKLSENNSMSICCKTTTANQVCVLISSLQVGHW